MTSPQPGDRGKPHRYTMPPPPSKPRRHAVRAVSVTLATLLVLFFFAAPFSGLPALSRMRLSRTAAAATASMPPPTLNIITLATGPLINHTILEHNCAMVSHTRHRHILAVDEADLHRPYCSVCECRKHVPVNCPCPRGNGELCFLCEKQHFYVQRVLELGSVLWHDADLVFLRDDFLDKLAVKTVVADFLATYIPLGWKPTKFYAVFNSGLFFLRRVEGVDYGAMKKDMYETKTLRDQQVLSRFVHRHVRNWDTLSFRWHCRFLKRVGYDIPLKECMTLHDRLEMDRVLAKLNFTFLKLS